MKIKPIILSTMLLVSLMAAAIPAKRGLWRTIRLADGTEVHAQLCGDENLHFFADAENNRYISKDGGQTFHKTTEMQLRQQLAERKTTMRKSPKRIGEVDPNVFQGTQRGLVILVEFQDVKFQETNNRDYFGRIINEEGFSDNNGFRGSVKDYFRAQSYNQFTLDFDVMGPITMPNGYAYYGTNNDRGDDQHAGEMTALACQMIANEVDFSNYDWNNDGEVDQVYIIYAGKGEHNSTDANTIWPHSWTLSESDYGKKLTISNMTINSYACSNEVDSDNHIEGIGTVCHEFSHCMGFPDTYDVLYAGNYGMGNWDLMCSGSYAGDTFCPVGYTSYERMLCGWNNPIELLGDTIVSDMAPITEGGETYIIYNKANRNEYYLLENRAKSGWDDFLPGEGLLVLHVDYDSTLWALNVVNCTGDFTSYGLPGVSNDHQRLTIVHADNDDDSDYFSETLGDYWKTTEQTDPYPYLRNDSLTNRSKPAATLFNKNLNGRKLLNVAIKNVKRNENGNISFTFEDFSTNIDTTEIDKNIIFYESFNQCIGKGGNDNLWSGGEAGTGIFMPDHEDWESKAMFGADKCAKFGTNSKSGAAKTPEFTINQTAEFSFKAAPFENDGTYIALSVSGNATISPTSFTLTKEQWTECNATITGDGAVRVTITPTKRMFLDEVKAVDPNITSIENVNCQQPTDDYWYTINGIRLNGEPTQKGIYIYKGKKKIK